MRILTLENREHDLVREALTAAAAVLRAAVAEAPQQIPLKDRLEWIGIADDYDRLRIKITPPQ